MAQIDPVAYDPIWPWMQQPFGDWLFSGFTKGADGGYSLAPLPAYPGQMTVNPEDTILPKVASSWQPFDGGMLNLMDYFANNRGGIGTPDPLSTRMMNAGGAGGPGNQAMSYMMQFGTPSEAGSYVSNMAKTGMSSPGAGQPLSDLAYGNPTGAAAMMAPFLMGQASSGMGMGNAAAGLGMFPVGNPAAGLGMNPYAMQPGYVPPNIASRTVQRRA